MKANDAQIERALRVPPAEIRLFLLYGPDEAGTRARAELIGAALGAAAERVDLMPSMLRQDPALLADEAASASLFASARWVRIEGAGEECVTAVQALLDAPATSNPVVLIAGNLRKDSKLVALATSSPAALAHASWPPSAQDFVRIVAELARGHGLQADLEVARALAAACDGDRALASRELEKFALYLDASSERPRTLELEALALLGVDVREGDYDRLVEYLLDGRSGAVANELVRLTAEGNAGIPMLRRAAWRLLQLGPLRARVEEGESVSAAVARARPPLKRDGRTEREIGKWRAERIALVIDRLAEAQRTLVASGSAGTVIAEQALISIARGVARER